MLVMVVLAKTQVLYSFCCVNASIKQTLMLAMHMSGEQQHGEEIKVLPKLDGRTRQHLYLYMLCLNVHNEPHYLQ